MTQKSKLKKRIRSLQKRTGAPYTVCQYKLLTMTQTEIERWIWEYVNTTPKLQGE